MIKSAHILLFTLLFIQLLSAQQKVPSIYSNISLDEENNLVLDLDSAKIIVKEIDAVYKVSDFDQAWETNEKGLVFKSDNKQLKGIMYFGLIPYGDSKHPQPVYFKETRKVTFGKTAIEIDDIFVDKYDMVGWRKSGKAVVGYRVVNSSGRIIYDGLIGFSYDSTFTVDLTILEGPFVNLLNSTGATISFKTNKPSVSSIMIDGKEFKDEKETVNHEIKITGLKSDREYVYKLKYGNNSQEYSFQTAHTDGSRKPFVFGYASDCRGGNGGGERNIYGHNAYIVKKIMALSAANNTRFLQFTGDIISGYSINKDDIQIQYSNFKRTISPFASYFPLVVGMGNHESLISTFAEAKNNLWISIDKFPFETESSENIFAENFVNPKNGLETEDGAYYDPDKNNIDFPSYKENVFHYTYGNVAMIVLNSNYFYAPSTKYVSITSGNIHGYIMDNQLKWLEKTLENFEKDKNIDHVFVTIHTPAFPNGGHVASDMYYDGNNDYRPYVAGKALKKGIIERRDELLNLLVNKNKKTVALLVGDEHNYCKLKLEPATKIYPDNYPGKKIKLKRTFWQINNGAAGAPYYAQEETPWSDWLSGFTTQNALVLFYVEGKSVKMKVLNPDTLELVDEQTLR